MKPLLVLFIASAFSLFAAEPDLKALLQKGLVAEEADGDLAAAATAYEELVKAGDAQQKLIATALFRLAEVKRKLNKNDEAVKLYQRVVADFSSQETLTKLARENLTALGQSLPEKAATATSSDPLAQAKLTLAELKAERERLLTQMKPTHPTVLDVESRIAKAQIVLDQLDDGPESAEIARLEKMLRESPDRATDEFPLHLAAVKGWSRLATAMLKRAGELNRPYNAGDDAVYAAELKRWTGYPPLSVAAAEGNKVVADILIQGGARLDIGLTETGEGSSGLNPLWIAIQSKRLEIIKLLLKQKINPAGRACITSTPWGVVFGTALATAINTADLDPEAVKLLLAAGFDAGESLILGSDEQKPQPEKTLPLLSLACTTGRMSSVEALIGAGAQVNASGSDGKTPLFHSGGGGAALAALLIKHGADVNARDKSGTTPFLNLIRYTSVLPLLLAKGADPKVTDQQGRTALHLCAQWGIDDHAVYHQLLALPIDPEAKDKAGKTALDYALEHLQSGRNAGQTTPAFDLYLTARTKMAKRGVWSYSRTASPDERLTSIYTPMSDSEPLPTLAEFLVLVNHYSPESRWSPPAPPGTGLGLPVAGVASPGIIPTNQRRRVMPVPGGARSVSSFLGVMHRLEADAKPAELVTFLPNFKSTQDALFQPMKHGDAMAFYDPENIWQTVQRQLPEKMKLAITVSFNGIEREFAIGESDSWHPVNNQLPYGCWDEVLQPLASGTLPLDMKKVKITRVINGQKVEKVINVQAGKPASWPRLMNGDRVELTTLPDDRNKVTVFLPDTGYAHVTVPQASQKLHLSNILHAIQMSQNGGISVLLGRDWSRVLIWHGDAKEPQVYDLAKVEATTGDSLDPQQNAEAEPVLEVGDRVELPPLKERPGEPVSKHISDYLSKVGSVSLYRAAPRVRPAPAPAAKPVSQ